MYISLIELLLLSNQIEEMIKQSNILSKLIDRSDDNILYYYFMCISHKITNQETTQLENTFENFLKNEFNSHWTYWDYDDIEAWLPNSELEPDVKKYITKLTEKLKAKKKD